MIGQINPCEKVNVRVSLLIVYIGGIACDNLTLSFAKGKGSSSINMLFYCRFDAFGTLEEPEKPDSQEGGTLWSAIVEMADRVDGKYPHCTCTGSHAHLCVCVCVCVRVCVCNLCI